MEKVTRREKFSQMNKDLILEAAAKLFTQKGYHEISLNELSSSIGATKGLVYHYFRSKGDVLANIHLLYLKHSQDYIAPFYSRKYDSTESKLRQIIKAHVIFNCENKGMLKIIYETTDMRDYPPDIKKIVLEKRREYFLQFESIVKEGIQARLLPDIDIVTTTSFIMWSLDIIAIFHTNGKVSNKKLAEIVADFVIRKHGTKIKSAATNKSTPEKSAITESLRKVHRTMSPD